MRSGHGIAFIFILAISGLCRAADVSIFAENGRVRASNGALNISINLQTGRCDYAAVNSPIRLLNVNAGVKLDISGAFTLVSDYPNHALSNPNLVKINTPIGPAQQLILRHTKPGWPALEQIFTLYPGKPWMLMQLRASAPQDIHSNWMAPIFIGGFDHSQINNLAPTSRILQAPFDNDDWRWYTAHPLDGSGVSGTGHEFSTIYDNGSNGGIVMGAVTHDFWKTGIDFTIGKSPGTLDKLIVYGGAGTDDVCPHGAMVGNDIISPTIFLGFFPDVRDGLREFARANAGNAPPLPWHSGVPFGWMTFGGFGAHYRLPQIIAISDFIRDHLQSANFHGSDGSACIILDGNRIPWDAAMYQAAVNHIHKNGQKAGCYLSPFIYWRRSANDNLEQTFFDSHTTYAQAVLRDDRGRPIQHKPHSYALDVTQPAVRASIMAQIDQAKQMGFDYFKFDFMTEGSLEGHHVDARIHTGMEAYNQAMKLIAEHIGPGKFISLSIAPTFPTQYAQSRRNSCDTYSQINDHVPRFRPFGSTQYIMNCATWSWWLGGDLYPFNDPDEMAVDHIHDAARIPESWARARVVASIVCGGNFIDSTDYLIPTAATRAQQLLANPLIDAVAREGIAFMPILAGDMEKDTANMFWRARSKGALLAVFNYDAGAPRQATINFRQLNLSAGRMYTLRDLWTNHVIARASDHVQWVVPAGDGMLLEIDPD